MMRALSLRCLFVLAILPCLVRAEDDGTSLEHRFIGPGSGGSMFGIVIDPENPDHIMFGGDMGAAYRTKNGGLSWEIIGGTPGDQPGAGGVWQMKASPVRDGTYWSVGGGAYKSIDRGKTWQRMTASIGDPTLGAVGIDPNNPNKVYIAEGYPPRGILSWVNGNVWRTTNGGADWTKLPRPGGPLSGDSTDRYKNRTYANILVDTDRACIYLCGRGGLFRWDDTRWEEIGNNIPGYKAKQAANIRLVRRNGQQILFATLSPAQESSAGGVYRSDDGGQNWAVLNTGIEALIKRTKKSNRLDSSHLFAFLLAHSPDKPNRLYLASHHGLARSDDLGEHWAMLTPVGDADTHTDYFYRLATDPRDFVSVVTGVNGFKKSLWGGMDQMNRIVASPSNGDLVLFGDNQDLYRSIDGGRQWKSITFDYTDSFVDFEMQSTHSQTPITARNRYEYRVRSRGVQNLVSDAIAVSPDDPNTLYAAYMDVGLQISRDGGHAWEHPVTTDVARTIHRDNFLPPRGHTWALAVDPGNPDDVYVSHLNGGLYLSRDRGRNWKRIFNIDKHKYGFDWWAVGKIASIAIDTASPVDERVLYIATERRGVFKSNNGGATWMPINQGLPTVNSDALEPTTTIEIDPADRNRLYLGTQKGLFVSIDGGASWNKFASGLFGKVESMSICQQHPEHIYVTAHLAGQNGYWGKTSIWHSDDRGKNWSSITPDFMAYAGAVAVSPIDPHYIYACTNLVDHSAQPEQKALIVRSSDGGKHWQDIGQGIAFSRGRHINIDPTNHQRLFVHTRFGIIEIMDFDGER